MSVTKQKKFKIKLSKNDKLSSLFHEEAGIAVSTLRSQIDIGVPIVLI